MFKGKTMKSEKMRLVWLLQRASIGNSQRHHSISSRAQHSDRKGKLLAIQLHPSLNI